jgi:hypothetical protein
VCVGWAAGLQCTGDGPGKADGNAGANSAAMWDMLSGKAHPLPGSAAIALLALLPFPPVTHKMQAALTARAPAVARPSSRAAARPAPAARSVRVMSAPKPEAIEQAVKDAEESCAGGATGEW